MAEVAERLKNVYEFVAEEETNFQTNRVPLASNWRDWNMYEHIDRSYLLKNSRFYLGNQDYTRPFINIILPIANVSYRSEGFDIKDVELYVNNAENYHKSFLVRKFHTKWARTNQMDTAIDESVESYFDYGLTLVKNVGEAKPQVVPLQQIAFCDQTNIMAGPICLKHHYTLAELQSFKGKWDDFRIEQVSLMARMQRDDQVEGDSTETPGKYVEVYELHGNFPNSWLGKEKLGSDWEDDGAYSPQLHIISYFVSPTDGKTKVGVTLYKGKEPRPVFKALTRDPIYGRACGRGGIEELFHPQIWANFSMLNIKKMLETTAKVVLLSGNKKTVALNNFSNIKDGQILEVGENSRFEQMPLQPINKPAFDGFIEKWEQVARGIGSASDPQLGINPTSNTPLGTTEIVTAQGQGIHEYRRGKIAEFWQEIYHDWVLPHIQREINKGDKWVENLSLEELQEISDTIAVNESNKRIKKSIIDGKRVRKEDYETIKSQIADQTMKGGDARFLEVLKNEFNDLPLDIEINIANKDRNTADILNKLNSVFRTLFTPEALQQNSALAGLFNEILESAGLSPIHFAKLMNPVEQKTSANQSQSSGPVNQLIET